MGCILILTSHVEKAQSTLIATDYDIKPHFIICRSQAYDETLEMEMEKMVFSTLF